MSFVTYERFGSLVLPIYDPSEPLGSWPLRSAYTDVVSGGAYRLSGAGRAAKGRRTVRRQGTLLAPVLTTDQEALVALWAAYGALEAAQGTTDRLYGRTPAGALVWTQAELSAVQSVREPRDLFRFVHYVALDVDTEFVLFAPAWYAEPAGSLVAADLFDQDGDDVMTLGAEGDAVDGTTSFMLFNRGNLASTRIAITITSGTGTISAVTLTNVTTGHVLAWTGSLGPGKELVINAGAERVTVDGTADWSGIAEPADRERWLELASGENVVTLAWTDSATDDTSTIAFAYDHTSA